MLTPEQLAQPGTEHAHQKAIMHWVATEGARRWPDMRWVFAVPNGANYGGDRRTGARMRAEGLRAGVPDICWPCPVGTWPGLWIELKRPGAERLKNWGRSGTQVEWTEWLAHAGHRVVLACGWEMGVLALSTYAENGPMQTHRACRDYRNGVYLFASN